jgi:hypothetical protein
MRDAEELEGKGKKKPVVMDMSFPKLRLKGETHWLIVGYCRTEVQGKARAV